MNPEQNHKAHYYFTEVCKQLGIKRDFLMHCLQEDWVKPALPETLEFDEEDLARIHFIVELREDFGVNDEAVPIILHLVDELYYLREEVASLTGSSDFSFSKRVSKS